MRWLKLCLCVLVLPIIAACGEGGGSKTPAPTTVHTGGLTTTLPSSDATGSYSDIPYDIVDAAKSYAPLIQLHSQEKYFPCSVDFYLENSGLRSNGTLSHTWITKDALASAAASSRLEVDDSHWQERGWSVMGGESWKQLYFDKWPAYVSIAKVTVDGQSDEFLIIQYKTFYAYNTVSMDGKLNCTNDVVDGSINCDFAFADQHWADWEKVSVIAARPRGSTGYWYFKAIITKAHDLPMETTTTPETDSGHSKVYAALHAHGTFIKSSDNNTQHWGDMRDDGGIKWRLYDAPNEIVDYHTFSFANKEEFASWATKGTQVYRKKWADFQGNWGVSEPDNVMVNYGVNPLKNWEAINVSLTGWSPGSYLGISGDELAELKTLLN